MLTTAFQQLTKAAERGDRITGVSTGFPDLDKKTAGLHRGDLMIIAARPGMGKTAFALNLAVNVAAPRPVAPTEDGAPAPADAAEQPGHGVAVFSLEMPKEQVATRLVCTEARVDLGRLRQGHLGPDDWAGLTGAASVLSTMPIWIDDTPALGLLDLRAKVRRLQAELGRGAAADDDDDDDEHGLGVVIIDYLQLMQGRRGVNSREQEISEISRGLKQLAKELRVPVIALSQLNRGVETRGTKDKRPLLADLRESGAIEQDADTIIFIYRDEYYNPETTQDRGVAELIISKQRNGPTGKVLTRFTSSCTRFDSLARDEYDDYAEYP